MKASIWWFLTLSSLAGCATSDLRTDYEIAQGIELTPEQIEIREFNRRESLEAFSREMKRQQDKMRLRRLVSCGFAHYLECW